MDTKFQINIYMTTIRNAVGTIVGNINRVADVKKRSRNRFEDKLSIKNGLPFKLSK